MGFWLLGKNGRKNGKKREEKKGLFSFVKFMGKRREPNEKKGLSETGGKLCWPLKRGGGGMRDFRASFDGGKKGREACPLDAKVEEEKAKVRLLGDGEGGKVGLRSSKVTDGDGIGSGRAGESETLKEKKVSLLPFYLPYFFFIFFIFKKYFVL